MSQFLLKALSLARSRRGYCSPNPSVGAVLVREGEILAEGFHWASGHPHAEVEALKGLSEAPPGSTLYVTLEPCCHWGKTPPCTDLIREKKISRVVFGYRDPNPVVHGKGQEILKAQGIECLHEPMPEIDAFYQSYNHWVRTKRPYVTAKLALSLDGHYARRHGGRIQLSGPEAFRLTHSARLHTDGILTTSETILSDDPQMNVRLSDLSVPRPVYVMDRRARLPLSARLLDSSLKTVLFVEEGAHVDKIMALRQRGADVRVRNHWGVEAVISHLGEEGRHDVWVESGAKFVEALLTAGLVDTLLFYVCPKWLGQDGLPALSSRGQSLLASAKRTHWRTLGVDSVLELNW